MDLVKCKKKSLKGQQYDIKYNGMSLNTYMRQIIKYREILLDKLNFSNEILSEENIGNKLGIWRFLKKLFS